MPASTERSGDELVACLDASNARVCSAQREMLRLLAEADDCELWQNWGARDMAHWVCMRYGISHWKALRWIAAANALEGLPLVSEALATGELSLDKTVELTRFATPETESRLIRWARGVSVGCIREKGDLLHRSLEEAREAEQARSLRWWYSQENSRFGLSAELPAADGAVVARALDRLAERLPVMPSEDAEWSVDARRADALVMLCSGRIARDPDPDRATVIIHARLEGAVDAPATAETEPRLHSSQIEGGPAIHPEVARRLACTGRIQVVAESASGQPLQVSQLAREPSGWMMRQLRYRDREHLPRVRCPPVRPRPPHRVVGTRGADGPGQPGPGLSVPPQAGPRVRVEAHPRPGGRRRWFHPDGTRYRAGPGPPAQRGKRTGSQLIAAAIG